MPKIQSKEIEIAEVAIKNSVNRVFKETWNRIIKELNKNKDAKRLEAVEAIGEEGINELIKAATKRIIKAALGKKKMKLSDEEIDKMIKSAADKMIRTAINKKVRELNPRTHTIYLKKNKFFI